MGPVAVVPTRTDGALKVAFAIVLTALVTGAASYFGQEARQTALIETHSVQIQSNAEQVSRLIEAQGALVTVQAVLISRFDEYIKHRELEGR